MDAGMLLLDRSFGIMRGMGLEKEKNRADGHQREDSGGKRETLCGKRIQCDRDRRNRQECWDHKVGHLLSL